MFEATNVVAHKNSTPALWHSITEGGRTIAEAVTLSTLWPYLNTTAKGDGHPVLMLPGFLGGDASTTVCRAFLKRQGFNTLPWLLGTNTGTEEIQNALLKRFIRLRDNYRQPISLVGHSLGGVFAREIARRFPHDVRLVVTLGSPIATGEGESVSGIVRMLFEQVSGKSVERARATMLTTDPGAPTGVPSTAIFSRNDGVVHWRGCIEQETPLTENIEVYGSHCGMVVNASVLCAVADRLAQPLGQWQKFDRSASSHCMWYPKTY